MAKNISFQEFKAAVQALNKVLKDSGEKPIKVVGIKKEVIIELFTNTVLGFIKENKTSELPNIVIDFYNNNIVEEDEDDSSKESSAKDKPKSKKTKKGSRSSKESSAKDKPAKKKSPESSFKFRLKFMGGLIDKNKYTLKEVTAKTVEKFSDVKIITIETNLRDARNVKNTKFDKVVIMDKETKILSWTK